MPKFLKTIPHVLVVLTAVQKAQQDKIQGILKYARLNGPWDVQLLEDRPYISKLGMLKNWHPDGIITRGSADTFEGQPVDTKKFRPSLLTPSRPFPNRIPSTKIPGSSARPWPITI